MRNRRRGRIHLNSGRYYGDFRDLGGKQEALKPSGAYFATDGSATYVRWRGRTTFSRPTGVVVR